MSYDWYFPIKVIPPRQVGKLRRVHFVGDPVKRWIDGEGKVYEIDYRSGNRVWIYSVCFDPY